MADVNVTSEILRSQLLELKQAADQVSSARKYIVQQYEQVSVQWNDSKNRELGAIVNESNTALRNIEKVLLQGQKNLALILKEVIEYESTNISSSGIGTEQEGGYTRHLSPEEVNARWQSAVNSIDEQINNYREALHARGVPDCAWLNSLLAKHRANMLEQSGYELDVASGNAASTTNNGNAYQYPGDYTSFYNQLAADFRKYCAETTNPNYNPDCVDKWYVNCQRCVPTYEMLRRGEHVTALPCESDYDYLASEPFSVWNNPLVIQCTGNDQSEIESSMRNWGDGARAQVTVMWTETQGHTFVAEQRNGVTHYIDPQSGNENYVDWIDSALPGRTQFCRIDNLETTDLIRNCYREVE